MTPTEPPIVSVKTEQSRGSVEQHWRSLEFGRVLRRKQVPIAEENKLPKRNLDEEKI